MIDWQPIETAPVGAINKGKITERAKHIVLIFVPHHDRAPKNYVGFGWSLDGKKWHDDYYVYLKPTHWAPSPDGPNGEKTEN